MAGLLDARTLAVINTALKSVVDTFFTLEVIVNVKVTNPDKYGENPVSDSKPYPFEVLADHSVGKSGRYQDINKTDMGQRDEASFHLYFWADDIEQSGVVIDPQSATVTLRNVPGVPSGDYEIRMFAPTAMFSDLGFRLYDMELKIYGEG